LFNNFGMKKTVSLGIRIDESLADMLEEVSEQSGIKPASIARMAIEEYLLNANRNGQITIPLSSALSARIGTKAYHDEQADAAEAALPPLVATARPSAAKSARRKAA
jgi:hypothetical protein